MSLFEPDRRPLLLGLAAGLMGGGLLVLVPPGTAWRDIGWTVLMVVAALSIVWFERRMSRRGKPIVPLRWVALGVAVVAVVLGLFMSR